MKTTTKTTTKKKKLLSVFIACREIYIGYRSLIKISNLKISNINKFIVLYKLLIITFLLFLLTL